MRGGVIVSEFDWRKLQGAFTRWADAVFEALAVGQSVGGNVIVVDAEVPGQFGLKVEEGGAKIRDADWSGQLKREGERVADLAHGGVKGGGRFHAFAYGAGEPFRAALIWRGHDAYGDCRPDGIDILGDRLAVGGDIGDNGSFEGEGPECELAFFCGREVQRKGVFAVFLVVEGHLFRGEPEADGPRLERVLIAEESTEPATHVARLVVVDGEAGLATALVDQAIEQLIQVGAFEPLCGLPDIKEICRELWQKVGMEGFVALGVGVGELGNGNREGDGKGLLDQHRSRGRRDGGDDRVLLHDAGDFHRDPRVRVGFAGREDADGAGFEDSFGVWLDLVGEDAPFEGLARHAPIDDGDAGAAVAVLPEKLDVGGGERREVGRVEASVCTVDFNGEVETFAQVDAWAGGGDIERDFGEGRKSEGEEGRQNRKDRPERPIRPLRLYRFH